WRRGLCLEQRLEPFSQRELPLGLALEHRTRDFDLDGREVHGLLFQVHGDHGLEARLAVTHAPRRGVRPVRPLALGLSAQGVAFAFFAEHLGLDAHGGLRGLGVLLLEALAGLVLVGRLGLLPGGVLLALDLGLEPALRLLLVLARHGCCLPRRQELILTRPPWIEINGEVRVIELGVMTIRLAPLSMVTPSSAVTWYFWSTCSVAPVEP